MNTGLYLLRQINPGEALMARLTELEQVMELQDGTFWVDDDHPRDADYNEEIVNGHGVTVAWGIFDMDGTLHGKYRSLDRATAALRAAQPVIKTEVELELEADAPAEGN